MSVLTPVEKSLVNTHPQRTQLYLSIYDPQVALICQVNGAYDDSNQTVAYDNVSSGSYLNISDYNYQVALIGTSPNSDDVGRTWVRSATSGVIRFLESSQINWADNLYITVLKYTEIIPVFPRIIQNPSNEEDVIFYKVWDIPYSNQNTIYGTFINMGSNYAGFIENGVGTCYWSASGTSNLRGDGLTYLWSFEGAIVTGSTAHTPGNITWNQPGHYRVILDVTSTSGRTDRSIRYVSWYNRPGEGSNPPVLNFELSDMGGSRDGIGFTGRLKVRESIPETSIPDGALVVIFKDDWYGAVKQSIRKSELGRESIFFAGYINGNTIQYNYQDGWVEFEVVSPTNYMEITECFGVSVEHSVNPTVWWQAQNLTIKKALYHYYAWHSSVLLCCDFSCSFTDKNIQFFDADRTSLYDAGNSLTDGAIKSRMIANSLGHIWIEDDVSIMSNSATTLPIALEISRADWIETPNITMRINPEVSYIELGGIAYDFTNSTPLLAGAPGLSPGYRGTPDRKQGLALTSQSELNTIAGNLYAYVNSKFPRSDFKLRSNFGNLDIAPQEQIKVTMRSQDNPRGITWSGRSLAIRDVSWVYNSRDQYLIPSVTLSEMTVGYSADSIIIPVEPPDETTGGGGGRGGGGGSVSLPPLNIPPIPTTVFPGPGITGINVYENGTFKGVTQDFNFIGSIVRVEVLYLSGTSGETMAHIYFDGCGCSGTFDWI